MKSFHYRKKNGTEHRFEYKIIIKSLIMCKLNIEN
jgi:hypothetical protein